MKSLTNKISSISDIEKELSYYEVLNKEAVLVMYTNFNAVYSLERNGFVHQMIIKTPSVLMDVEKFSDILKSESIEYILYNVFVDKDSPANYSVNNINFSDDESDDDESDDDESEEYDYETIVELEYICTFVNLN